MAGLTSERMRRLIDEAREAFDWVIIDTPPVGLLTDANLLASMVDGAVLVVKAGSTPYDLVKRAVDAIGRERLLGVVLNRADEQPHGRATTTVQATTTAPTCRRQRRWRRHDDASCPIRALGRCSSPSRRCSSSCAVAVAAYVRLGD